MTDLEQELLALLKEERARVDVLIDALLRRDKQVESVVVPDAQKVCGATPWEDTKRRLERKYRRVPDASEDSETVRADDGDDERRSYGSPEDCGV